MPLQRRDASRRPGRILWNSLRVRLTLLNTGVVLLADQSGSIVIDIQSGTYAAFPTNSSICAAAKPTISAAQKSQDTTLTGWTTAIAAGNILEFVVDSASTVTQVTVVLTVTRSI